MGRQIRHTPMVKIVSHVYTGQDYEFDLPVSSLIFLSGKPKTINPRSRLNKLEWWEMGLSRCGLVSGKLLPYTAPACGKYETRRADTPVHTGYEPDDVVQPQLLFRV